MSGGIKVVAVDFSGFLVVFGRDRCASSRLFPVRNWCGSLALPAAEEIFRA
jgi:hypothetical protein